MNDQEITEYCALAMGLLPWASNYERDIYAPLHDDAQAMALVKKFGLNITHSYWDDPIVKKWNAHHKLIAEARNADLNRAICECCAMAKMQEKKIAR